MQEFKVKTDKFEGPLDLLLELVEKKKLHITEFSLAEVTDDFLNFIDSQQPFPLESASEFLVIASTLLLIKSKALLPFLDLSEEEKEDIEELEIRLRIYKEIKLVSAELASIYGKGVIFAVSPPPKEIIFHPTPLLSFENIEIAIQNVLNSLPKKEEKPKTKVRKIVSLEEVISRLEKRIKEAISLTFKDFAKSDSSNSEDAQAKKIDVVISFLALLELVKQGIAAVKQEKRFDDIYIESQDISTPRYGN